MFQKKSKKKALCSTMKFSKDAVATLLWQMRIQRAAAPRTEVAKKI
jgi:hypothetical protein